MPTKHKARLIPVHKSDDYEQDLRRHHIHENNTAKSRLGQIVNALQRNEELVVKDEAYSSPVLGLVRRAKITDQWTLFYRINQHQIELLRVDPWDSYAKVPGQF